MQPTRPSLAPFLGFLRNEFPDRRCQSNQACVYPAIPRWLGGQARVTGLPRLAERPRPGNRVATSEEHHHRHHHSETGRCQSPKVSLACLRKCQSRFGGAMPSTSAD